ncbi:hypothetical protein VTJ04DRAFT_4154 [Mycothermus thermophilus]|uniref:uncharacterized protein n=1 Tax=Humicola insolens TaxID=85995 RepID=UPI003742D300
MSGAGIRGPCLFMQAWPASSLICVMDRVLASRFPGTRAGAYATSKPQYTPSPSDISREPRLTGSMFLSDACPSAFLQVN